MRFSSSRLRILRRLHVGRWGEGFALGGLAGLPFAGKSGFRAYLHHVPDNGKLVTKPYTLHRTKPCLLHQAMMPDNGKLQVRHGQALAAHTRTTAPTAR